MAALNLTAIPQAGAATALTAAAVAGDSFPANRPIIITVRNNGAALRTITMAAQRGCVPAGVMHNKTFGVPNDNNPYEIRVTDADIPFYADANGRVQLTYDVNTGLSLGAHAAV